ncbi:MAG TPA: hypothetical protein VG269_06215 [Tepidisphaeraceae bacterium]|jgi:hypothetical protein|nr:hypothetical protein [Tepidisphaeraceae bacterium]
MLLSVPISSEVEAKLKAKAAGVGLDVQTFAAQELERIAGQPSLDEILAPLRAEFDASQMSEDELADLLESAKHEMRAARRARQAS